jgi:hypothetical protein
MASLYRIGRKETGQAAPAPRRRDPRQTAPDPADTWWRCEQKPHDEQLRILEERKAADARLIRGRT